MGIRGFYTIIRPLWGSEGSILWLEHCDIGTAQWLGIYEGVRWWNPSPYFRAVTTSDNHVAPYGADYRLEHNIHSMFVSNYFVVRQENYTASHPNICRDVQWSNETPICQARQLIRFLYEPHFKKLLVTFRVYGISKCQWQKYVTDQYPDFSKMKLMASKYLAYQVIVLLLALFEQ